MYGKVKPAQDAFSVTPNDSTDLTTHANTLWVGTAGDLKVTTVNGTAVTLTNAEKHIPLQVKRAWSTGTTASDIVGFV